MVSLVGFSLFLSLGYKDFHDRFYQTRYAIVQILLLLHIMCSHPYFGVGENHSLFEDQERITRNVIPHLKQSFPYFQDRSLIYIKEADDLVWWALGRGAAIRLNYDNNISVYFEGITKKVPSHSGKVYYFYYDNDTIHFLNESTE